MPSEFEFFWISSSGLTHPQTKSLKSRSRILTRGSTGFEASVTGLDTSEGKVLLHAKRFRLIFVDSMASAQEQNQEPHMYYHIEWKPDIDLCMTSNILSSTDYPQDQKILNNYCSQDYLKQYLNIVTFKDPNMRILHFSLEIFESQSLLLDLFLGPNSSRKPVLCHETYTLVDLSVKPGELHTLLEAYKGLQITSCDTTEDRTRKYLPRTLFT